MRRLFGLAAGLLLAFGAHAGDWPTKPVTMLVSLPAGSATDIVARALAERLSAQTGQRFIVENRPGASGAIAMGATAKAEPDGYTTFMASSSWSVIPSTIRNLNFSVRDDIAGVTIVANVPNILVVRPDSAFKTTAELVAYSKANPGKLSYATVGQGSATHLNAVRFQLSAGLNDTAVPFRGTAQALTDLIGGRVDYCFCPVSPVVPFVKEGKLLALASGSSHRSSALPDVQTTEEQGYRNSSYEFWVGLGIGSKTPPGILRRIHAETVKALESPEIKSLWAALGQEFQITTPEQFDAYLRKEIEDNAVLVRAANIAVN